MNVLVLDDEVQYSPGYRLLEGAQQDTEVRHLYDGVLQEGKELWEDVALNIDFIKLSSCCQ